MPQCRFSITLQLGCVLIKLDDVLGDVLSILHAKVDQLSFGVAHGIVGAEVGVEFFCELLEVVHPHWMGEWVLFIQEVQLKPVQCHPLQVQLCKDYLGTVIDEGEGAVLVVELALDQEHPKLAGFCPIELVGFSNFCPGSVSGCGRRTTGGTS
jgi:hypothetical protein